MSTRTLRYLVPTLLLVLAFAARPASAKRLDGVATAVKSAEELLLDTGSTTYDVRIYGIDAPDEGQPFAAEAKEFVRSRVLGKNIGARFKIRNAAGEMVSRVFVDDEQDLAVEMLRRGLAWRRPGAAYKPSDAIHADELTAAELDARTARRGLWSQASPTAPWTYRGEVAEKEASPSGTPNGVAGTVDRNTSQKTGDDNECAIAKNPANPLQLFVFCNTSGAGMFAARSTDGGATWIYPDPADKTIVDGDPGQGIAACCDPSLAWDSFGNLFVSYLGNSPISVDTLLSTDGGATFTQLPTISASGNDQQTVVTADITGGAHVVWVVFNQSSTMKAVGASVTGLGAVGAWSPVQTAANPGGFSCSFGDIAIAPSGAVVQVCEFPNNGQGPADLLVNIDPDGIGGAGFGPAITATSTNVGGFDFIPAQASRSVDAEAGLAYDRNPASPHFGRLYMVYSEETVAENNNLEVLVRTSDNNGATWSAPVTVNTDATTRSQFMPKIATDPVSGDVVICWHDARGSGSNTAMEIYCDSTTAANFPAFLGNTLVSDGASTSNGAGVEFGDYMGIAAVGGSAHPVWSDTSNSTGNNPNGTSNFDIYTDQFTMLAADYTLGATPPSQSICAPANAVYTVNVGAFGGYTDQVTLSASGHPAGTTTNFSVNPVTPVGASTLTIGNTGSGTPGPATITISATSTTGPKAVQVTLNLSVGFPAAPSLTSPPDTTVGVLTQPTLVWAAVPSATSYFVEVSDDPSFTTVDYSATVSGTSHQVTSSLAPSTQYSWRVTATNGCGSTPSGAFTFTTANILTACGGAITINDNGAATPYPSTATVALGAGAIVGIDLSFAGFTHTYPDDVDMLLVSPSGQKMIFMSDVGGGDPDVSGLAFTLSGGAATLLPDGGPLVAGTFRPSDVDSGGTFPAPAPAGPYSSATPVGAATFLSTFGSGGVNGGWKLFIVDDAGQDVGSLSQWCLNFTLSGTMPFIDGFESNNTASWSVTIP